MTMPNIDKATDFIWRNARLIDRHRFAYHFRDGSREAVVAALRPYQNADGGFGSAIEPDLRDPNSQPIGVWTALGVLDEVDAFDDPMVTQACDYLLTVTTAEDGVPFVLPSAKQFPHAPWWEGPDDPPAAINPTAGIAAFLYKHGVDHPWLTKAADYCWRKIDAMDTLDTYELGVILAFLEQVSDHERAERALERISPKMFEQQLVSIDPVPMGDAHRALDFAPRPGTMAGRLFSDDVIEAQLDAMAAAQDEDGGWSFAWPNWNAATGLAWRAVLTIQSLVTLKAYGRV